MRVAMIHWAFPPVIGGVETHLSLLCPELTRLGWQVNLLTGAVEGEETDCTWAGGYIHRSPLYNLNDLTPDTLKQLDSAIREETADFLYQSKPDLIHIHNLHYFSPQHLEAVLDARRELGVPLVLTAHNVWHDELWREMLRYRNEYQAVICVSDFIRRELVQEGFPPERLVVIHHGIDAARFAPNQAVPANLAGLFADLAGRRVLFHPARISLAKGCDTSLRALAVLRREFPDVALLLCGNSNTVDWGSQQQEQVTALLALAEKLGINDAVHLRFFPWEEMPVVYGLAELCLYPSSFEEPFGLAVLEAMASARPVVVTRAGGMPEIVEEGVTGYLVEKGDYQALAKRVALLLSNPSLARQIGTTGRQRVLTQFTVPIMAGRTQAVYQAVLTSHQVAAVLAAPWSETPLF